MIKVKITQTRTVNFFSKYLGHNKHSTRLIVLKLIDRRYYGGPNTHLQD
jgi:hypothetical protein